MSPKGVKTIRELLYWEEYAKLILPAAQLGDYSEFYKKKDHEDLKQWLKNNYTSQLDLGSSNYCQ